MAGTFYLLMSIVSGVIAAYLTFVLLYTLNPHENTDALAVFFWFLAYYMFHVAETKED